MKKITALLLSLILAVSMSAAFADELMDFTYAANVYAFTDEGLALFTARNGLCGFVNTKGEVAIPAQFETASSFSEGLAAVSRNGLYGFINTQGELVIDYQWASASNFSEGLAYVKSKEDRYGYIDTTGALVIPTVYSNAYACENGCMKVEDGSYYMYINKAGETIDAPSDPVQEIFTIKRTMDGSKGIYELLANGRGIATTTIYNILYGDGYSYDIIYPVENAESLWVICQNAKGFSDDDLTVSRILYDAAADKILMEDMEDIETTLSSGLIAVKDDKAAYYVNEQGVMAIPPIGTEAYTFVDGIARVDIGDTCVFINPEGQIISDVYDKAYSMKNGFTTVQQNGQWFVINDQFQRVR
ncbi:MAG: WG repeat-containing protein [Clostridia bacterium]|nr:WG repeat-containing protein [Clostridia bacterium]